MTIIQTGQIALENGVLELWQPRSGGEVSYRITPEGYREKHNGRDWHHFRYSVTFRRGPRTLTTQYSMGIGRTDLPDARDVMASMFEDAQSVEWEPFETWAQDYGYEIEDTSARTIYNKCEAMGEKLRTFFGSSHDQWQDIALGWDA